MNPCIGTCTLPFFANPAPTLGTLPFAHLQRVGYRAKLDCSPHPTPTPVISTEAQRRVETLYWLLQLLFAGTTKNLVILSAANGPLYWFLPLHFFLSFPKEICFRTRLAPTARPYPSPGSGPPQIQRTKVRHKIPTPQMPSF